MMSPTLITLDIINLKNSSDFSPLLCLTRQFNNIGIKLLSSPIP